MMSVWCPGNKPTCNQQEVEDMRVETLPSFNVNKGKPSITHKKTTTTHLLPLLKH